MSRLSFVIFPYRMPDGFLQREYYDTKQIFPAEFRMRFCVVTKEGRLICSEDGDLQYDAV